MVVDNTPNLSALILQLTEQRHTLNEVRSIIAKQYETSFDDIARAYVDRKYVKHCMDLTLKQINDLISQQVKTKRSDEVRKICKSLIAVKTFGEMPSPLCDLPHHQLLLSKYNKDLREEIERQYAQKYQLKYLELTGYHCVSLRLELNFHRALLDFLKNLEKSQITETQQIFLRFSGELDSLEDFSRNLTGLDPKKYGPRLVQLRAAAQDLLQLDSFEFPEEFRRVISVYYSSIVNFNETERIIEVIAGNIILSSILESLKSYLQRDPVEIRFISATTIHVDADLPNNLWHGRNVTLHARKIKVYGNITWDLSGRNGANATVDPAGTAEDGHGLPGSSGEAGESGGNVLLLADTIENGAGLRIVSKGGNGGNGQEGGEGKNGTNGETMTFSEFKDTFPAGGKFAGRSAMNNVQSFINHVTSRNGNFDVIWCNGEYCNLASLENFISSRRRSVHLEGTTIRGNRVHLSMAASGGACMLYKGTNGVAGRKGGAGGLGGEGGYGGTVEPMNAGVGVNNGDGSPGENGKGGWNGTDGQTACDYGYVDWIFWSEPIYYGKNRDKKLEVRYYSSSGDDLVYNNYKEKYVGIRSTETLNTDNRSHRVRNPDVKTEKEREHHARASRKRNIVASTIRNTYADTLNFGGSFEFREDVEAIGESVSRMVSECRLQEEKRKTEETICHVKPVAEPRKKPQNVTIIDTLISDDSAEKELTRFDFWLGKVTTKQDVLSAEGLLLLRSFELDRARLTKLWDIVRNKNNLALMSKKVEAPLLLEKYKLMVLREIGVTLSTYQYVAYRPDLDPEDLTGYLIKSKEKIDDVYHDNLGHLSRYLLSYDEEQRKDLEKFCGAAQKTNEEALRRAIVMYLLSEGQTSADETIKKYYRNYVTFSKDQQCALNTLAETLKEELRNVDKSNKMKNYVKWLESISEKSPTKELEDELRRNESLRTAYENFNKKFLERYNWQDCYGNKHIMKKFNLHVQEKGPRSSACRELLAYVFEVNLKYYTEDSEGNMIVTSDHNPAANRVIRVLYKHGGIIQLKINEDYVVLREERRRKAKVYAKIVKEIESCSDDKQCENVLSKKITLSETGEMEEKKKPIIINEEDTKAEGDRIAEILKTFSSREDNTLLTSLLEKISTPFIGRGDILTRIAKCFSCEGRHIVYEEFCFLIQSILSLYSQSDEDLDVVSWILLSSSQRFWLTEIILVKLENYFKCQLRSKQRWRTYLSQMKNKSNLLLFNIKLDQYKSIIPLSFQSVQDILYLLSGTSETVDGLQSLELTEWPYVLKEKYWMQKLMELTAWHEDELQRASYYLLSIENSAGTSLVEAFAEVLKDQRLANDFPKDKFLEMLQRFHNGEWDFNQRILEIFSKSAIETWTVQVERVFPADGKERSIRQLVELIKGNANTSETISRELSKIQQIVEDIGVPNISESTISATVAATKFSELFTTSKNEALKQMLSLVDSAIFLKRNFHLRDTQKLAILAFLENSGNTLVQVSTGEGKSLIVVALSIIRVLCGKKVDVITSSSVLAKRDAKINRDIYQLFNINVAHNCDENVDKRKEAYSKNSVIYGDLSSFQRDYLLDKFYRKNIRGDRNFENVIVDEVDSMLLDKGCNMLYLSHNLPDLDKLVPVYIYIWQWINSPAKTNEELHHTFDSAAIKQSILADLYDVITKSSIRTLDKNLTDEDVHNIWNNFHQQNIIEETGRLLTTQIPDDKLNKILSPNYLHLRTRLNYFLQSYLTREKAICVPNYLKPFVERHLDSWINSAKVAFFMQEREDYIVDIDRTQSKPDRNPNIIILDRDTGTDLLNSEWDEALHQFLQIKHGCRLSVQNLKAVFISNVTFLNKVYQCLYGLTGTLGSQRERNLLTQIYEVAFATVPTAKVKKFREEQPILCTTSDSWVETIYAESKKLVNSNRSLLIICETVGHVETIQKIFQQNKMEHVYTYTRDYEEFDIAVGDEYLEGGRVIIATNLAGRGTDVRIKDSLNKAGGLHVILTCLPQNNRIEQQGFGRAARSGNHGSGRLIILDPNSINYSTSMVSSLKSRRDFEEIRRINDIKIQYDVNITLEERAFDSFKTQYDGLRKKLQRNKVTEEVYNILLQSCLDKWSFWLDDKRNGEEFNEALSEFIEYMENLSHDKDSWSEWLVEPAQFVKLAKVLATNKEPERAVNLLDKVIKREPDFCDAARYYKAYALAKMMKVKSPAAMRDIRKELREAARLFNKHSMRCLTYSGIVSRLQRNDRKSIVRIVAFEEQQKSISSLYDLLARSVDDILGHPVTQESFVDHRINQEIADALYDGLIGEILRSPRVTKTLDDEKLSRIRLEYGLREGTLEKFLRSNKRNPVNEREFVKELTEEVAIPSREEFWQCLTKNGALTEEIKYVLVNMEILRRMDADLAEILSREKSGASEERVSISEGYIELNPEVMKNKKEADIVLEKSRFKKLVGKKYKGLKKEKVISCNKQAKISVETLNTVDFPRFDSLKPSDLISEGITETETKEILQELVENKVLKAANTKANEETSYSLITPYDPAKFKLSCQPVYRHLVKSILQIRFMYRIVLERLKDDLANENQPIQLQLIMKPHRSLFWTLTDHRIVKPAVVSRENNDDFEDIIKKHFLGPKILPLIDDKKLFSNYADVKISGYLDLHLLLFGCKVQDALDKSFTFLVNDEDKTLETIRNTALLDEFIDKVKKNVKTIESLLKDLSNSFSSKENPELSLRLLSTVAENLENINPDDLLCFLSNGLDHVLHATEKKWTTKMLLSTVAVIVIGFCQIVTGAIMELYSVGLCTHLASTLIGEGIGDIFFAISCLATGEFSWQAYKSHKIMSIAMSAVSFGIAGYLSRGAKLSHYGSKLAAPGMTVGGKEMAKTAGKQLINVFGKKVIAKEVAKRIAQKTIQGMAFGLTNVAIDAAIERCFQSMCRRLGDAIMTDIDVAVQEHDVSGVLETAYQKLGPKEGRKLVDKVTTEIFENSYSSEAWRGFSQKLGESVTQGVRQAFQKKGVGSCDWKNVTLLMTEKVMNFGAKTLAVAEIRFITQNMMNNIKKELLKELSQAQRRRWHETKEEEEKEVAFDVFRDEIVDQWRCRLKSQAQKIIQEQVVAPVLKHYCNKLVHRAGRFIADSYRSFLECRYAAELDECKKSFKESLDALDEDDVEQRNVLRAEYDKSLIKIMSKTRSPEVFAAIIRENMQMDVTCVTASLPIIKQVLTKLKISSIDINILVEGNNFSQIIGEAGTGGKTIYLRLDGNHYTSVTRDGKSGGNNCLYDALVEQIPELASISPEEFRDAIAHHIATSPDMKYLLSRHWHRFAISQGFIGGAKRYDEVDRVNPIKEVAEGISSYQTGTVWRYNENCDVDLRSETGELGLRELFDQRVKAMNIALAKVNQHLETIQSNVKDPVFLTHQDFAVTLYDGVPLVNMNTGESVFVFYPVQMDVKVSLNYSRTASADFNVRIDLDNPPVPDNGPAGPHIGYEIKGPKSVREYSTNKMVGHILVDRNGNENMPHRHKDNIQPEYVKNEDQKRVYGIDRMFGRK